VHLTVAVVRYNSFERDRAGLATGFLADRVTVDETHVPIFIQPTRGFVIPEDGSRDIIMVGPGTGIAPFRAFLEQREMDEGKGRNWLIFGEWFEKTTFFYEDEFRAWQESGVLTRLDTAFSRDQDKKIYVQHRLQQAAAEVWKWLDEGAYFYVCGDKDYMAKDVHQALIDIAQKQGGLSEEEAEHYVNRTLMKEEKRYLRDVY
jgi:sulfite reductase (NADPH) flavoprotein alpha-component